MAFPVLLAVLYLIYKYVKIFHTGTVIVDKFGITIKEQRFEWKDITQTFIIDEANGARGRRHPSAIFLVIAQKDQVISKFEITYLGTSPKMLATIVEYFKNKEVGNLGT